MNKKSTYRNIHPNPQEHILSILNRYFLFCNLSHDRIRVPRIYFILPSNIQLFLLNLYFL